MRQLLASCNIDKKKSLPEGANQQEQQFIIDILNFDHLAGLYNFRGTFEWNPVIMEFKIPI